MSGEQPPSPLTATAADLVLWRLVTVERDVADLNKWREGIAVEIQAMKNAVADNTRRLNQIGLIVSGTFITVLAGLIIFVLTGGHR